MARYIDTEKLKAEIERRMNDLTSGSDYSARCELREILTFIESLQQEQPEMDLEEEISRTYHDGSVADTSDIDHNTYGNIAHHFAEWGAIHLNARKEN